MAISEKSIFNQSRIALEKVKIVPTAKHQHLCLFQGNNAERIFPLNRERGSRSDDVPLCANRYVDLVPIWELLIGLNFSLKNDSDLFRCFHRVKKRFVPVEQVGQTLYRQVLPPYRVQTVGRFFICHLKQETSKMGAYIHAFNGRLWNTE